MRVYVAVALIAVGLCGCMPVRGTGEAFMSEESIGAKDDGVCRSFGSTPGTQSYVDCRLRLRSDRSTQDSLRRL